LAFHSDNYGPNIAAVLSLEDAGGGARPMELFPRGCTNEAVRETLLRTEADTLFPDARDSEAALSGLLLYFSCLKEAHDLLHTFGSIDGAYWHGIMHRMEGDAYNANYWFRRIPGHPVFRTLQREAAQLGYAPSPEWDPFAFTGFCASSARTGNDELAKRVQLAEWQLLFDYCASPVGSAMGKPAASRMATR
jgi:hypothetical protein